MHSPPYIIHHKNAPTPLTLLVSKFGCTSLFTTPAWVQQRTHTLLNQTSIKNLRRVVWDQFPKKWSTLRKLEDWRKENIYAFDPSVAGLLLSHITYAIDTFSYVKYVFQSKSEENGKKVNIWIQTKANCHVVL